MKWDSELLFRLTEIVNNNYDDFRDEYYWFIYLNNLGIKREPYRVLFDSPYKDHLWMECPWSVHNSIPGVLRSKWNIFIPYDLAEKILVLGEMPVVENNV